jgi:hypothetical protein
VVNELLSTAADHFQRHGGSANKTLSAVTTVHVLSFPAGNTDNKKMIN